MNLVWFRSDLRVIDNSALWNAVNTDQTIACCLLPLKQWRRYGLGERKIEFIRSSAEQLKTKLALIDVSLFIEEVDTFSDQSDRIFEICNKHQVKEIYWNNEYPLDERKRDDQVTERAITQGINVRAGDDNLILPPGSVRTLVGDMYKVYTPFKRAWISIVQDNPIDLVSVDLPSSHTKLPPLGNSLGDCNGIGIYSGENSALDLIDGFFETRIFEYKNRRDIPSDQGTSKISAHLSIGTVSPGTLLKRALEVNQGELATGDEGIVCWISELIWREFYFHLISVNDKLSMNQPFKPETDRLHWNDSKDAFDRWCTGMTGVPIVDAGMRQLNQTGWMHNRVRMITAMYLTKNLFVDWRKGESYFLSQLVDADFALNNGGWQWSASTGTDAVPYFRVFNPFSQASRFDPDAEYIKKYVPELKGLSPKLIHNEQALSAQKPDIYPLPIVDTKSSRAAAIDAFKMLS